MPREPKTGNVSNFRRLNPKTLAENEGPLEAEQWLTDTVNILDAANVPTADRVKVAKVQLMNVARTWWLAEETKLKEPITWKQFSDGFYARLFPPSAKQEMEEKFIALEQ